MTAKPDHGVLAEHAADAIEDAAASLVQHLADLDAAPIPHGLDARVVLLGLSRALASSKEAAGQLAHQGWFDLGADAESTARWQQALAGLSEASAMFEEIANGWI